MEVRLLLKKASRGRSSFRLHKAESIIGRGRGCAVRIPSTEVSREHCRVVIDGDTATIQDLGSVNGTLLNGVVLDGIQELQAGDFLRIGPVMFEVQFVHPAAVAEQEPQFEIVDDVDEVDEKKSIAATTDEDDLQIDGWPTADEPIPLMEVEETPTLAGPAESLDWKIPNVGDLRDLLADLEDGQETNPETPSARKKKKKR